MGSDKKLKKARPGSQVDEIVKGASDWLKAFSNSNLSDLGLPSVFQTAPATAAPSKPKAKATRQDSGTKPPQQQQTDNEATQLCKAFYQENRIGTLLNVKDHHNHWLRAVVKKHKKGDKAFEARFVGYGSEHDEVVSILPLAKQRAPKWKVLTGEEREAVETVSTCCLSLKEVHRQGSQVSTLGMVDSMGQLLVELWHYLMT